MPITAASVIAEVGADTSKAERSLKGFGDKLNATGKAGGQALTPVRDGLTNVDKAAKIAMGGIVGFGTAMGVGAIAGFAVKIGGAVIEMGRLSEASGRLEGAFDGLAAKAGTSGADIMTKLKAVSGGAISEYNLMLAANKAMLLGVASNTEDMGKLMEIATVRGQAMGLSATQALDNLVTGLGRGSALILDNLGIMVDADATNKEYAESIGKTVAQLTEQEKKQALVNRTLKEAEGLIVPAASSYERMAAAMDNLKVDLGDLFGPAIAATAEAIAAGIGAINDRVSEGKTAQLFKDFEAAQANIGAIYGKYSEEYNKALADWEAAAAVFKAFNPDLDVGTFTPDLSGFDELSMAWRLLERHAQQYNDAAEKISAPKLDMSLLRSAQMETTEQISAQAAVDAEMERLLTEAFEKLDRANAHHNEVQAAALAGAREYQVGMLEVARALDEQGVSAERSTAVLSQMAAQYGVLTSSVIAGNAPLYDSATAMQIVTENAFGTIAGFQAMEEVAIAAGANVATAMIDMSIQVQSAFATMFASISAMGQDLMRSGPGATPGPSKGARARRGSGTTLVNNPIVGGSTLDQFEGSQATRARADHAAAVATEKLATKAGGAASKLGDVATKAGDLSGKLQGLLDKIPGLKGTSDVTEEQMADAKLGIPQNFADDYLRRLTDEVLNGVDWAGVDMEDAARRAGIDPSLPVEAQLKLFSKAWQDSSLFADPKNLELLNMDAIKAGLAQQQAAAQGSANIDALFGLGDEATVASVAKLGLSVQSGLSQWLTDNGMPDAGAKLAAALGSALGDAGDALGGGVPDGLNSYLSSTSGSAAIDGFGKALGEKISASTVVTPILNLPASTPPPNGGSASPGGSDLPPVGGAPGKPGRGAQGATGASVVINAIVQAPHDIPLLAKQVAREIQKRG